MTNKRIFLENCGSYIIVKIITENTFTSYCLEKELNYIFGQKYTEEITSMGYTDMKHCIKRLKQRGRLHKEITKEELNKIEINGLINLGLYRLRNNIDVPVDHVCKELEEYGIEFEHSKKMILDMYENRTEYFETVKF